MTTPKVNIAGQIAEVHRELAMRRNTYPRLIASSKMRENEAELCSRRMEAVLETLMFCQRHEAAIRTYISERKASQ